MLMKWYKESFFPWNLYCNLLVNVYKVAYENHWEPRNIAKGDKFNYNITWFFFHRMPEWAICAAGYKGTGRLLNFRGIKKASVSCKICWIACCGIVKAFSGTINLYFPIIARLNMGVLLWLNCLWSQLFSLLLNIRHMFHCKKEYSSR
jgi:hypothetical protein